MASEKIVNLYPSVKNKLDSILVVSAMLVVGKLSELNKEDRNQYRKELEECHIIVKEYSCRKEVVKLLPKWYFLKCILFKFMPIMYMYLYQKSKTIIE